MLNTWILYNYWQGEELAGWLSSLRQDVIILIVFHLCLFNHLQSQESLFLFCSLGSDPTIVVVSYAFLINKTNYKFKKKYSISLIYEQSLNFQNKQIFNLDNLDLSGIFKSSHYLISLCAICTALQSFQNVYFEL